MQPGFGKRLSKAVLGTLPLSLSGTIKAGSQGLPHPLSWSGLPGWASLTNAVVPHVMITIITLLPRLQDAIPTGAMLVYGVTHRVERGQLAKETQPLTRVACPGSHKAGESLALKTDALGLGGIP